MTDRISHRAAVEAGYADLKGYIEKWGDDKMDITDVDKERIQDLLENWSGLSRIQNKTIKEQADEIERLQEAVIEIVYQIGQGNNMAAMDIAAPIAEAYMKQKGEDK